MSDSIPVKTAEDLEAMRRSGRILAEAIGRVGREMKPGMTTAEVDRLAETTIRDAGAVPAFKGYRGYPASVCISVNEEVVHGIPGPRVLREGDLVGIDLGAILDGWYSDAAETFYLGEPPEAVRRFMETSRKALRMGIEQMRPGNRLGDVSAAVQREVESAGYGVVRALVGHGIGRGMHEEPQVPNYGHAGTGPLIREGMVFAIEPMVNMGTFSVRTLKDGWTVVTADGSLSAHYEHTVAATAAGPDIITRAEGKDGSTFL
jgi:methionyl aminopeptidase